MRRSAPLLAIAFAGIVLSASLGHGKTEIDQKLRYEFRDKTLVLRGFYPGKDLHYDSTGVLRNPTSSGDWTVDGIVHIEDISISRDHLRIKASRQHWGWVKVSGLTTIHDSDGRGHLDKGEKKNRALQIEADLGPNITLDTARAAVSRVFLDSKDNFVDFVPDYWKPCVAEALQNSSDTKLQSCRFSVEFLRIPGMQITTSTPSSATNSANVTHAPQQHLSRIGLGVSPPKALYQDNPSFSESARKAKFQGTVTLGLIVDASGKAEDVHVLMPLGCGLDDAAVRTVRTWKFKPSLKEGNPVAVEIAVEVDFHLY